MARMALKDNSLDILAPAPFSTYTFPTRTPTAEELETRSVELLSLLNIKEIHWHSSRLHQPRLYLDTRWCSRWTDSR